MAENERINDGLSPAANPENVDNTRSEARKIRLRPSLSGRLRAYFFAGVLVTAPMAITFWLAWQVISWIDRSVKPLIPAKYNPETYLPFSVPGIGLIVLFAFLVLVGAFAAGLVGRLIVRISERILARMPVIRSVYGAVKQIFETVLANQSSAFREVVLIEYPRRGLWALAFITGTTQGEVQEITEDEVVNVFMPTTPNPTSGFLLFIPRKDMTVLSMSVEEGIKMVVSGGIVTPPDRRPPEKRKVKIPASTV
ncbi:MAG: DUF502 domain-containing protein [Dongiaceae bacterium]